ncbi:MAG: hypothetical protein JKY88_09775 [Pseudomonadales bacterium]|nr:hypothetical protein [Pseudomonadales bacterium]
MNERRKRGRKKRIEVTLKNLRTRKTVPNVRENVASRQDLPTMSLVQMQNTLLKSFATLHGVRLIDIVV